MSAQKITQLTEKDQVVALVAVDSTDAAIMELTQKYSGLKADTKENYELVKRGYAEFVSRRTSIDKRRLSLKRDVDSEAARLTKLLAPVELELKTEKDKYEEEEKARKAAKAAAEKARVEKIQNRISTFSVYLQNIMTKNSEELKSDLDFLKSCIAADTFNYEEFINDAEKTKFETEKALTEAYSQRKALEDREAEVTKQRDELARQQKIIDEARRAVEEKANADRLEQERIENARRDKEQEALKAAQPAPLPKGTILIDDPLAPSEVGQAIEIPHCYAKPLAVNTVLDLNSTSATINCLVGDAQVSTGTYSLGQGAKLELLICFVEEITQAGGKYADLDGHKIVADAYKLLQKIGVSK